MTQQQHEFTVLVTTPPDIDRARRDVTWIVIGFGNFCHDDVSLERSDHTQRRNHRFGFSFLARPAQQQRVGAEGTQSAALHQVFDAFGDRWSSDNVWECFESFFDDEFFKDLFLIDNSIDSIFDITLDDLAKVQNSKGTRQPVSPNGQIRTAPTSATHR